QFQPAGNVEVYIYGFDVDFALGLEAPTERCTITTITDPICVSPPVLITRLLADRTLSVDESHSPAKGIRERFDRNRDRQIDLRYNHWSDPHFPAIDDLFP